MGLTQRLHTLLLNLHQDESLGGNFFVECAGNSTHASRNDQARAGALSDAWLAVLKMPMSMDQYKRVLNVMHEEIMPRLVDPRMLHDFLTDSYNQGMHFGRLLTL
jgi:hypothetical protein